MVELRYYPSIIQSANIQAYQYQTPSQIDYNPQVPLPLLQLTPPFGSTPKHARALPGDPLWHD